MHMAAPGHEIPIAWVGWTRGRSSIFRRGAGGIDGRSAPGQGGEAGGDMVARARNEREIRKGIKKEVHGSVYVRAVSAVIS